MPTSLQTTNLNVSPYYDDYNSTSNYYQTLFRPRPVQSRELNSIQSTLQNQIQALGQNIFKQGSPVLSGGINTNTAQNSIGITITNGSLSTLLNETSVIYVQSVNTGLVATVSQIIQPTATLPTFLFLNYISAGTSGSNPLFILNETCNVYVLNADGSHNQIATITCNQITQGQLVTVLAGTYFAHGVFVDTNAQTVVVSPNSITSNAVVGFYVTESIITTVQDASLFSNAFGTPNYKAPGADRLKITLNLTLQLPTDVNNVNFIELVSFKNGIVQTIVDSSQYAAIADTMALRTYETNGNYVVNAFGLNLLEDLNSPATPNGVFTAASGGNINDFVSQLKPGIAYVQGYRIQNVGIQNIVQPKARTTTVALNSVASSDYGNYIIVNGMTSMPCMDITKTFNLKNSTGVIVGTTKVLSIRASTLSTTQAASTYSLYLFNTIMNGSYNFSNVTSISYSDASNLFSATLVSAMVFNGSNNSLLFPLSYTPAQTLAPNATLATSYSVMREYDLTTDSNGGGAITANANEIFGPIDPNTYFIAYTGAANTGTIIPITGTLTLGGSPIGRGLSVALGSAYANKAIKMIVPVNKTITTQKTKTLTTFTETLVFGNVGSVNLSNSDIYSLTSVIDSTTSANVTANYTFNNGQLINTYAVGSLSTVTGSPTTETVVVTYQYFAHSTGDYFTIDSYAGMARENIPTFTLGKNTVSLADCFDFRPTQNASGQITSSTFNGDIIKPTDSIRANVGYYLPRKDVIYVDTNGNFASVTGTPAVNPVFPTVPNNAMALYDLTIPAYTSDITQISQTMVNNTVYTMKDIGKLDTRLSNVEYYTSLNLMETSLNALQAIDPVTGNTAFKNGFASDGFTNFILANVNDPAWGAGLNFAKGQLTAATVYNATDMQQASLTNGSAGSNLYTLPYTKAILSQQPYASRTSNINPYAVYYWSGNIAMSPSSDFWVDTQFVAPKIINNATLSVINNYNVTGIGGVTIDQYNAYTNRWPGSGTIGASSSSSTSVYNSSTSTTNVIATSVIPYMRSIAITVTGQNFRPYANLYAFFDAVNVSAYCTPSGGVLGGQLTTDITGSITFTFNVPDTQSLCFPTGVGTFQLIDNVNASTTGTYTSGSINFTSGGTLDTNQVTVVNTQASVTTNTTTATQVFYSSGSSVVHGEPAGRGGNGGGGNAGDHGSNNGGGDSGGDPLAQSFTVTGVGGNFITGVDIFFQTKAASLPVRLEIREVVNGLPTNNRIPLATVTLNPSAVNVSSTGTVPTTFQFSDPIYLQENTFYAMVLMANTQEYNVYIAQMGDVVIGQQIAVAQQPNIGVMFTSKNNATWTPNQMQTLKFTVWGAVFNTTTPAVIEFEAKAPPAVPLSFNALTSTIGSPAVTMYMESHGLISGDTFTIAGAIANNGLTTTQINAVQTVVSSTIDNVVFNVSSNATVSGTLGGGSMTYQGNIPFAQFWSNFNTQSFSTTGISYAYKYKQQNGRTMTTYTAFDPTNIMAITPGGVINQAGDLMIQATLGTNVSNLSPVIDINGMTTGYCDFRINSNPAAAVYQYVTDSIIFNNPSVSATFYVDVNLPGSNLMNLYYKPIYTADQNLTTTAWVKLLPTVPVTNNSSAVVEYQYNLSGIGSFIGYVVMVQFLGSDNTNTPTMSSFRTIAIA